MVESLQKLVNATQPESEPIDYPEPSIESQALDTEPKLDTDDQLNIINKKIEYIDNRYHASDSFTVNQRTSSTNGSISPIVVDCPYELVPGEEGAPLRHKCPLCDKTFMIASYVKHHIDSVHNPEKAVQESVEKGKPDMNELEVASLNDYTCGICDRKFENRSKLDIHVFDEHGGLLFSVNRTDVFACDICGMTTRTRHNIQRHYAIVHPTVKYPFIPKRKSDVASGALHEHASLGSFQSKPSIASCNDFSCSLCKRRFVSKSRLAEHIISEHVDEDVGICDSSMETHEADNEVRAEVDKASILLVRPIQCRYCGSEFRNQSRLKEHEDKCVRRIQTRLQTEVRVCPHCELKFASKYPTLALSRHLKNYVCRTCGVCLLVFDTRFQLHQHRRTVHKFLVTTTTSEEESLNATPGNVFTKDSRRYKCDLCSLKLNSLRSLRYHYIFRHPEEMHDVASHAACVFCDREFPDHNTLEKHMIANHSDFTSTGDADVNNGHGTSEDPMDRSKSEIVVWERLHLHLQCISCRFCRKQFKSNDTLRKHLRMFICRTCRMCKTRFKTGRGYQKHCRTRHRFETRFVLGNITAKIRTMAYRCKQCPRTFRDRRTLAAHRVVHNEPRFECSTCHGRFFIDEALSYHTKRHELLVKNVSEQAQIRQKLGEISENKVCSSQNRMGCIVAVSCVEKFHHRITNPTIDDVSSVSAVVPIDPAPQEVTQTPTSVTEFFACSVCKLFFTSELYLKNHHNTEHLVFHQCKYCPLKFKNRYSLSAHQNCHKKHFPPPLFATRPPVVENTGEFKCFMCRNCFSTKESFSQHYNKIHRRFVRYLS